MKKMKRVVALMLTAVMVLGLFSGCGGSGGSSGKKDLVTLTVYSQLANYSGEMKGWFAQIMEDKFGVKINLIPDGDGVYDTRMEAGNLGDIVVWGSDGKDYIQAVKAGLLYDWEEDDLLADYGPYINEHMQTALAKNRDISGTGKVYGFGHNVASSADSHDAFFYTWDIRWDLYEQLGHPKVHDLDDLMDVLIKMKEICPTGDDGKPTYAMSIWPDWDGNYVMYVKAMATAYYGYDEWGFGHYNVTNGEYYDALSEGSPYLTMLHWFNELYRNGLLDPDSMTQKYDDMIAKVQNGNVFFSIFNYAGSLAYNKEEHYNENKIMESLTPTEACPIVAGLSAVGGNRVWSIGAKTQYPELCMEIIDWLCTPEGRLTMDYGPKGLCWDYDENGKTYFTDFGKTCFEDRTTLMPEEWGGASFNDGACQINNTTWTAADINPESGERYDQQYWASTQVPDGRCEAERDWREFTGCTTVEEYMDKGNYAVDIPTTYSEPEKEASLEASWNQVATCLKDYSWRAIYAESEEEYDKIVAEMRGKAKSYGYDKCVEWSIAEAAKENALQAPLR
ncbi:MAG: extracellular solute-binding protein [Lachnospiraceae bacterium]